MYIIIYNLYICSERSLMISNGKKVGRKRDFQWSEEELDFPTRYGTIYI